MEELLRSIYDAYGSTGKSGISFFANYKAKISEFDPISVIVAQMRGYPLQHVLDFFLACPFLWSEFRSQEWKEIMRRASPRPDPRGCKEELSEFSDFVFLHRILRIDGLRVFLDDAAVARDDKDFAEDHFRRFPWLLLNDPEDLVDLDGSYFVSANEVDAVRDAILREGYFKPV